MSRLYSNASKFTYNIPKFRGLNENTDGDAKLKDGEASKILNYRVTDSGGLKVRSGFASYIQASETPSRVDGIYSGEAHGHSVVVTHCEGQDTFTMQFDGSPSTETASGISSADTRFFFFGDELYALSGDYFRRWRGNTTNPIFDNVDGYVPTVVASAEPGGSGTLYEQINKLTTSRKVRYNADGTATEYYIPEGGNVTIQGVTVDGAEKMQGTDYSVTQSTQYGIHAKVTFTTAPAAGINNVEVQYSVSKEQSYRSNVGETASGRIKYVPDGTPIADITSVKGLNAAGTLWSDLTLTTDYTVSDNVLTLVNPAVWSVIKVFYTIGDYRGKVTAMRYAESYNGAQDTRVFLYGDGGNTAIYSGLTEEGKATAEYFPDLNEIEIGDKGSPITAMIRHRNSLMVFKPHGAYSVYYNPVTLADNTLIAGFYVNSINRDVGCSVMGGAVQVENRIRTVDYNAVWEWKPTSTSGNITADARNVERISDRVCNTVKTLDLSKAVMFYNIYEHEFYLADGSGKCLVQNTEADAWYLYDNMAATAIGTINQRVIFGTPNAYVYMHSPAVRDDGDTLTQDGIQRNINAEWESGQLDFNRAQTLKYTPTVWVSAVPKLNSAVIASISTDNGETASAVMGFKEVDGVPRTRKSRLKARRFNFYKLKLAQNEATAHAVIISAIVTANYDIPVKR